LANAASVPSPNTATRGIYETALVRPPIEPWDDEERDEAEEFIQAAIELEEECLNSLPS